MTDNGTKIASLIQTQTRPLDLGGYAEEMAGTELTVWVNAPGIIELLWKREAGDYAILRKVVEILFDFTPEQVARFDDNFMLWLFERGSAMYTEYHASLKKK
jgi:hypothetical protein